MSDETVKSKTRQSLPTPEILSEAAPEAFADAPAVETAAETMTTLAEAAVEIPAAEAEAVSEVTTASAEALVETIADAPPAAEAAPTTWAMAEQSARRLMAMAEAGAVLTRGAHEASRSWLDASQEGLKLQRDGIRRVVACRTPLDLVAAEGDLALKSLDAVMTASQTFARISTKAMSDAGDALRGV